MLCIAELVAAFRIADGTGCDKTTSVPEGTRDETHDYLRTYVRAIFDHRYATDLGGVWSHERHRERSLMPTTRRHAPGHAPAKRRCDLLEGTFQFAGNNVHTSQTCGRPRITIQGRPKQICWRSVSVQSALIFGGKTMKLTPGKLAGLKRVSTERGVIAAAAMDQRGSLQKSLAKEKGGDVTDAMMEEFKSLVTEVLTPHASAILLDPEWGLPAAKRRAKNSGLLLAY